VNYGMAAIFKRAAPSHTVSPVIPMQL
jgi:hypothetical protein